MKSILSHAFAKKPSSTNRSSRPSSPDPSNSKGTSFIHGIRAKFTKSPAGNRLPPRHYHDVPSTDEGSREQENVVGGESIPSGPSILLAQQTDSREEPRSDDSNETNNIIVNPPISNVIPVIPSEIDTTSVVNASTEEESSLSRLRPAISTDEPTDVKEELSRDKRIGTSSLSNIFAKLETTRSAAKMGLELVKESSNAFPPLNSVAGGICAILKQFEQTASNKEEIRRLRLRIETLMDFISEDCDEMEIQRRISLKMKLDSPFAKLDSMVQQGKVSAFFKNADQAGEISGFVKEVENAITDYQTALQQDIFKNVRESAHRALLIQLPRATGAEYSSGNIKRCLPGTRIELLRAIDAWAEDANALRVYWLNGMAGTGKSAIAWSVAERFFQMMMLGASFFCSGNFIDRSELNLIFPTIAFQLACRFQQFRSCLINVIQYELNVAAYSLSDQFQKLLVEPLKRSGLKTVIVIDALDECKDVEPASAILSILSRYIDEIPLVKFFITGRPEPRIDSGFRLRSLRPHTETMILHEIQSSLVDRDITTFFKARFSELVETRTDIGVVDVWPEDKDVATLVRKSNGLFIYAETTFRFINSDYENPRKLLQLVVNLPDSSRNDALLHVDSLYTQILQLAFQQVDVTRANVIFERFRTVVGGIVLLFDPLSTDALASLLNLEQYEILTSLRFLHSLLVVPEQKSELIRIIHKSFSDYITDKARCTDDRFCINSAAYHANMVVFSLELMKKKLKRNICGLPPYVMNDEVKDLSDRRKRCVGDGLEYACRFWTKHLTMATITDGGHISRIMDCLRTFFTSNLLSWVEIFSISGNLSEVIHALNDINQWLSILDCEKRDVLDVAEDCRRFVLYFFDMIQESSQHIYQSVLPWCPASSLIRTLYRQELAPEVKIVGSIDHAWDSCVRTIHVGERVTTLAFSRRGDVFAVGDSSGRYQIVDAASGIIVRDLEVKSTIPSISFSSDSSFFAAGMSSGDILVWDAQTGGVARTLPQCGIKSEVSSVAFAPKGSLLASGAENGVVGIWDVVSAEPLVHILKGHSDIVCSVCWSDDGVKVISGSDDKSMKIWDANMGECLHTIQDQGPIKSVAWSPDGSKIASSTVDCITVYDARTYQLLISFNVQIDDFRPIDLSPNGDYLVYHSGKSVIIRDLTSNADITTFSGHTRKVSKVMFSPGGTSAISGADDGTVKIWTLRSGEKGSNHESDTPKPPDDRILLSPNGLLIATASKHRRDVKLWDAMTGSHIDTMYFDPEQVGYGPVLAFSPDSSLIACGDTLLIRIWNVETRTVISDLHGAMFNRFCFSPDGNRIAMYDDQDILLWDVRQGNLISSFTLPHWIRGLDFFEDGSGMQITIIDWHKTTMILDIIPSTSSSLSLPFELVLSNKEKPLFLRAPALYKLSEDKDWILDINNRSVCWIPQDRRHKGYLDSLDAHGAKVAWCSSNGPFCLDFSRISRH